MIQDVERLAIAGHLPHVLAERPVVDLDAGQHEHRSSPARDLEPVVVVDAVVVIGDGEEVVAELAVARDHLVDRTAAVRERRVGVEVALQERHVATAPRSGARRVQRGSETRRVEAAGTESQTTVKPRAGQPLRAHGSCETRLPTGVDGDVHPESPYFVPPCVCPTNGSMNAGW